MNCQAACRGGGKLRACLLLLLFLIVIAGPACAPPPPPAEPLISWPSRVITESGSIFYVRQLRLAGTDQALKVSGGGATFWLPLRQIQVLQFSGPVQEHRRLGRLWLTDGNRLNAVVHTNMLIQGETDLGYWSLPLHQVRVLEFGPE